MQNMVPVIVEEKNIGFIGISIILLVIFVIYTIASIYLSSIRYKKLLKAKQLIEEGHEKKMMDQIFPEEKLVEMEVTKETKPKATNPKRKLSI